MLAVSRTLVALVVAASLCGCQSAFHSKSLTEDVARKAQDGLVYFLPRQDIVVSVTIGDDAPVVAVTSSAHYPDFAHGYIVNYRAGFLGKHLMNVTTNELGLLTTGASTTTSGVSGALSSLAGIGAGFRAAKDGEGSADCSKGTYSTRIALDEFSADKNGIIAGPCKSEIVIRQAGRIGLPTEKFTGSCTAERGKTKFRAGLYYRRNIPYLVEVTHNDVTKAAVVVSPTCSPAHFLPIKETFFADNAAKLTLNNGIATGYEQNAGSEAAAFLSLPAIVIEAYADAITGALGKDKARSEAESSLIKAEIELARQQLRAEQCRNALASDNKELIDEACQ